MKSCIENKTIEKRKEGKGRGEDRAEEGRGGERREGKKWEKNKQGMRENN